MKANSKDFENIIKLWEAGKIKIINPTQFVRNPNVLGKGTFGTVFSGKYL